MFAALALLFDEAVVPGWLQVILIGLTCGLGFYLIGQWLLASGRDNFGHRIPVMTGRGRSNFATHHSPVQQNSQEKRVSFRREGNPTPVYLTDPEHVGEPFDGWVIDRSVGGLGLAVNRPQEIGAILHVRARNAPETIPWIELEVRVCRQEEKCYSIGCRFVKTPSWNILLHFG